MNRPGRRLILLYHRVASLSCDPQALAIDPAVFDEHMQWLSRNVEVVPLGQIFASAAATRVAVTFDDGYLDNLTEALPILTEHQVPATVFVTTRPAALRTGLWWDDLEDLLLGEDARGGMLDLDIGGERLRVDARDHAGRKRAYDTLHPRLRDVDTVVIDQVLQQLAQQLGAHGWSSDPSRVMDADDLRTLGRHPLIELGGHTRTHPRLPALAPARQRQEIQGCRDDLTELTGAAPAHFAFPFGNHDAVDGRSSRTALKAGFDACFSNMPGSVSSRRGRGRVPRHLVPVTAPDLEPLMRGWLR